MIRRTVRRGRGTDERVRVPKQIRINLISTLRLRTRDRR